MLNEVEIFAQVVWFVNRFCCKKAVNNIIEAKRKKKKAYFYPSFNVFLNVKFKKSNIYYFTKILNKNII